MKDLTWEQTILHARQTASLQRLVKESYLDENLLENVESFSRSPEFKETLSLLSGRISSTDFSKLRLLDLGAGNGISSAAFAMNGFSVSALEPDPSETVGFNAILKIKQLKNLTNLEVHSGYGENLPFENSSFDIVYARQAMHHAADLQRFVSEAARVLRDNGILLTTRDHIVNNEEQKKQFLKEHPLQEFYNGENAFSLDEYKNAFENAGFSIKEILGPLDSVVNYSPRTKNDLLDEFKKIIHQKLNLNLRKSTWLDSLIFRLFKWRTNNLYDQPGRLVSFIALKKKK